MGRGEDSARQREDIAMGAETNPELEGNFDVRSIWDYFEAVQHKRRRCYIRYLKEVQTQTL